MGYEIFNRRMSRVTNCAATIAKLGRFNFNKLAAETLQTNAVERVLLLWDEERSKIGIRPISKKDSRSYEIYYAKGNRGAYISSKTFLDWIRYDYSESRAFDLSWNEREGVYEMTIPREHIKEPAQLEIMPRKSIIAMNKKAAEG